MSGVGTQNEGVRHAWVQAKLAEIPPGSRLLDAGAGEQRYRPFCSHLKYVSQDFAQYDGTGDGKGLQTGKWDTTTLDIIGDIVAIPEPDASFDAILCTEVFEHIPHPLLALREFSRLLRPGGTLILTAPFASFVHFAPHFYSTGFSQYYYATHLPAYGFEIAEMSTNGNYFEFLGQEMRRLPRMSERYAGREPGKILNWGITRLLQFLEECSAKDSGSVEFAAFGYHVRAIRGAGAASGRGPG